MTLNFIVAYNRYGVYCVPRSSRHRPAARRILSGDVYEPETIQLIRDKCAGGGDVVQAGAYFGDFLPAISAAALPGAKVWAFEPNVENYRCAVITLELNCLSNVVLANAALGAQSESLLLRTHERCGRALGGASYIVGKGERGAAQAEPVQVVTIDDTVGPDRHVSVIHLDVERYEQAALAGALKTIRRCWPTIILEGSPGNTLTRLGYYRTHAMEYNTVFSCPQADQEGSNA